MGWVGELGVNKEKPWEGRDEHRKTPTPRGMGQMWEAPVKHELQKVIETKLIQPASLSHYCDDMASLTELNEPSVLHTIRSRYCRKLIHVCHSQLCLQLSIITHALHASDLLWPLLCGGQPVDKRAQTLLPRHDPALPLAEEAGQWWKRGPFRAASTHICGGAASIRWCGGVHSTQQHCYWWEVRAGDTHNVSPILLWQSARATSQFQRRERCGQDGEHEEDHRVPHLCRLSSRRDWRRDWEERAGRGDTQRRCCLGGVLQREDGAQ